MYPLSKAKNLGKSLKSVVHLVMHHSLESIRIQRFGEALFLFCWAKVLGLTIFGCDNLKLSVLQCPEPNTVGPTILSQQLGKRCTGDSELTSTQGNNGSTTGSYQITSLYFIGHHLKNHCLNVKKETKCMCSCLKPLQGTWNTK